DISTLLRIGPRDCEHRAEFAMPTWAGPSFPSVPNTSRCSELSRAPNGFAPLQTFCARPSQKLRKLKTAFTALGVLRPVTLRVLMSCADASGSGYEKTASGTDVPVSTLATLTPGISVPFPLVPFEVRPLPPICRLLRFPGLLREPGPKVSPGPAESEPSWSPTLTIGATSPAGVGRPTLICPILLENTPCDPETSFMSSITLKRSLMSASLRKGKSP